MSKSNNEKQGMPNTIAPTARLPETNFQYDYSQEAPPPTYEESQSMYGTAQPSGASYMPPQASPYVQYAQPSHGAPYAPQQAQVPLGMYASAYNYGGYQAPQPQQYASVQVQQASPSQLPVLALAKGAKIRTTSSGAVSIPPPPPGCAPTAAQMAAMQGQPVLVKKTKKSFF